MYKFHLGIGFAVCLGYVAALLGCLGSQTVSALGRGCAAIGPLMRAPLFYWLPHAKSSYLGIDSLFIAVLGNALFWAAVAVALVELLSRAKRRRQPR